MKKILQTVLLVSVVMACTSGFEELNTNTNEPESVSADLLLPTVLYELADFSVTQSYDFGDMIAQHTARYEFNELDIYNWVSSDRFWVLYNNLQDIEEIIAYGEQQSQVNYRAVGMILKAYCYSMLTDAYGDVPYTEANRAESGIISPRYDAQERIYESLLELLEEANGIIDTSTPIEGDLLYDGNMLQWQKFGNSLHVRLLMRTAEVNDIGTKLQQMVDAPDTYPFFQGVEDDAVYTYSGAFPDISPRSSGRGRAYEYFLGMPTTHFVDLLLKNDDPRIAVWLGLRKKEDGTFDHKGVLPGQSLGDIGRPESFSSKDSTFFNDPGKIKGIFMTYSELNFILAEAAERGMISQQAKDFYETGVQASFAQWGVKMPEDFLTVTASYTDGDLDLIHEQKWLALYHSGAEAWFDWKRTGKPSFIQAGPGNLNGDEVPVRLMYPSLEQSVNSANYTAAAQQIGGDDINTRVWWDRR